MSVAFSPGGGRVNITLESLYVGLSRVCHIDDLLILPYNDMHTLRMLNDLQLSSHLSSWIDSYSPIDELVSEMIKFRETEPTTFQQKGIPKPKDVKGTLLSKKRAHQTPSFSVMKKSKIKNHTVPNGTN
jgi:hypothetical protein